MKKARNLVKATICLSLTFAMLASSNASAATVPPHRHIVVLSYSPGDQAVHVRSIDGMAANALLPVSQMLPLSMAPLWGAPQSLESNQAFNPLLHTAAYYAAFVLLTTTAVYFHNAEMLSAVSLVGLPVLIVVSVRDISKVLRGDQ